MGIYFQEFFRKWEDGVWTSLTGVASGRWKYFKEREASGSNMQPEMGGEWDNPFQEQHGLS